MAFGLPDYHKTIGSSAEPAYSSTANQSIVTVNIAGTVATGTTGTVDISAPSTGKEQVFRDLIMSANEDGHIHQVFLTRISDGFVGAISQFIQRVSLRVSGFFISGTEQARLSITNNSAVTITISGYLTWLDRLLE
ncbi:MAG: hypothetical protein ACTSQY_03270 [Candidatus Odinarchaeia archaeon]